MREVVLGTIADMTDLSTDTDLALVEDRVAAIEQAASPEALVRAVQALADLAVPAIIDPLIRVLGYNNPAAALVAVKGLVRLGTLAVQPLLDQLDGYNYGARAYAIRALAQLADPRALAVLRSAAETDFAPSVRRAALKGLGLLEWDQMPTPDRDQAQLQVVQSLESILQDPDWSIQYAAVVGLQGLAQHQSLPLSESAISLRSTIVSSLQKQLATTPDTAVQLRIQWAIDDLSHRSESSAPFTIQQ